MILAGVVSGTKSFDAFAIVEKLVALSKFLLNALMNGSLLCTSRKRREQWVHELTF